MLLFHEAFLLALVLHAHLPAACLIATANYLLASEFTKLLAVLKMAFETWRYLVNNLLLDDDLLLYDLALSHGLPYHTRLNIHRLARHWWGHHAWLLHHRWWHHSWLLHHGRRHAWLLHHRRRHNSWLLHRGRGHAWLAIHRLLHDWLPLNRLHLNLLLLLFVHV